MGGENDAPQSCLQQDLVYLLKKKRYKVLWIAGILLWSFIYMFITFYCFAVTDEYVKFARTAVLQRFNRNIDDLSLFCVFPFLFFFKGEGQWPNNHLLESNRWRGCYDIDDVVITHLDVILRCENRSNVKQNGDEYEDKSTSDTAHESTRIPG
uniref:Uncharacterized protein n=1 Tax=Angiostrongylus cantonensis TaxID=6313 RepID=A0A0K0CWE5_ANGCA